MLQFYSAIRKVHFFYSNVLSLFLFNYYHMTWKTTTDDSAARRSCPAKALSWRSASPSRAMERQAKARVCLCVVVGTRQDWSPAGRHCSSLSIASLSLLSSCSLSTRRTSSRGPPLNARVLLFKYFLYIYMYCHE